MVNGASHPARNVMTLTGDDHAAVASELRGKNILITGGTGSWGRGMVDTLLREFSPRSIIIFSRDELKQADMHARLGSDTGVIIKFFLGDVRDFDRLVDAMSQVDIVFHAAALKQVPALEYNPFEAVRTNILGPQNVLRAANVSGVSKLIALSTDKAAAPVNLYGATKLCQDKLVVAANHMYPRGPKASVVRYGNVFASRGSVIPVFLQQRRTGVLNVTDASMTRFTILLQEGVNFVLQCTATLCGGEIFIPKLPSYTLDTVAHALAALSPVCKRIDVGSRPGEKKHEVMIPADEASNAIEFSSYYVICPAGDWYIARRDALLRHGGKVCSDGFEYSSGKNSEWVDSSYIHEQMLLHGLI